MAQSRCPCCGYYTLYARRCFDICPVCYWEGDDPTTFFGQPAPDDPLRPNHVQLRQARENYLKVGASEERLKQWTRAPRPDELPPS
jgi:hypothetical protein